MTNNKDLNKLVGDKKQRHFWRGVRRWMIRLSVLFIFLFIVIWALFQNKDFQNWLVDKVTVSLSERLGTNVEIQKVDFEFFDRLNFDQFYVEDTNGDTLLMSEELSVNLNTNVISLLQQRLEITDIYLNNTDFYLRRDSGVYDDHVQLLIQRLVEPDTTTQDQTSTSPNKSNFHLDLDYIYLTNARFHKLDGLRGQDMHIYAKEGEIKMDQIDFQQKQLDVEHLEFCGVHMTIDEYERNEDFFNEWYYFIPPEQLEAEATYNALSEEERARFDSIPHSFVYTIGRVDVTDASLIVNNLRNEPVKTKPDDVLDFNRLDVYDIAIAIEDYRYEDETFYGTIEHVSCNERSGFELKSLSTHGFVSPTRAEFNDLIINTPYSTAGDTLIFKYSTYEDFWEFPDKVRMDIRFTDALVALEDVMTFAPKLEENTFFKNNKKELIRIDGRITGKINNLRGRNLDIHLGEKTWFKGKFSTRNLAIRNEEYANLRLDLLQTDMLTLRSLIPNFNPPDNFDKLGNLNFSGRFDGFFNDFVADGDLQTDLGRTVMDMQMKLKGGRANAAYTGNLALIDFDLAQWTDNPDFGRVSFSSKVTDGYGLTLQTLNTKLSANIQTFPFKGYEYQNLTMEGALKENYFNGDFSIRDDNIDFAFHGSIDFEGEVPAFDFDAHVNRLALQNLNLSQKDYTLYGDIDLNLMGNNISDMLGVISLHEIGIVENDTTYYNVDDIYISSRKDSIGQKDFRVQSTVLDAKLKGDFEIDKVPNDLLRYFVNLYPSYAKKLGIRAPEKYTSNSNFDFDLTIFNTQNLTRLINPRIDTIKGLKLKGRFDQIHDEVDFDLSLPYFQFDSLRINNINLLTAVNEGNSQHIIATQAIQQKGRSLIDQADINAFVDNDTARITVYFPNFTDFFDDLFLESKLFITQDDKVQLSFLPSRIEMLDDQWEIPKNNFIQFGEKSVFTNEFRLFSGDKNIALNSKGRRGLQLLLDGFNASFIDEVWDYDKLDFEGPFRLEAVTEDIYTLTEMAAVIELDTLRVNGDDWGAFQLNASLPSLTDKLETYISIANDTSQLIVEGFYIPPKAKVAYKNGYFRPNEFSAKIDIGNYPLKIAEYFITSGISETVGSFNANARIFGIPKKPEIEGELRVFDGALNIDYLGTRYYIHDQAAQLTSTLFDATGSVVRDKFGNTANVFGGIAHDNLKNLRLAARIEADRFLALDTDKEDNPLYYGQGIGSGIVNFSGSFRQANISATAVTGEGTRLVIPVNYDEDGSEVSFIEFIDPEEQKTTDENPFEIRGVNVDLNLQMTDQAETLIVFDERTGDILKGKGEGNLKIGVTRTGDFTMYGTYDVAEGEYLFTWTLPNTDLLVVNKPFIVKQGGTIRWFGDPFEAQINLEAEYKGLKTSTYNLIAEYLEFNINEVLALEARQATAVDLKMFLKGELLQPNISFDINLPDVTRELASFVDNKIRVLKQDANELNRQVFGLLVLGVFLPSSNVSSSQTGGALQVATNTLSQVVSSQLSMYVTEWFREEFIKEGGAISNLTINVNYNQFANNDFNSVLNGRSELSLNPSLYFLNDRLSLNLDVDFGFGGNNAIQGSTAQFTGYNFSAEYSITEDRRLKVRVYNRYDQTLRTLIDNRIDVGAGIRYKREFNTIKELRETLKQERKEKKEKRQIKKANRKEEKAKRREEKAKLKRSN